MWAWVLAACALAFGIKLLGYLVPDQWLEGPRITQLTSGITVGLLASLVALNTFVSGVVVTLDARAVALGCAAVALVLRAPFIVVVIVGALAAALSRLLGFA